MENYSVIAKRKEKITSKIKFYSAILSLRLMKFSAAKCFF